jgi:3-oxoacyl-[acyl-carrier-protein] synthase II
LGKRRVVVTGLGMVSPVGLTVPQTWEAILAGKSGIASVEHFDTGSLPVTICATVKDFDPSVSMSTKEARKVDTFIQYGLVAAEEAIKDSGFEVTEENADRCGVAIGSGIGGLPMIEKSHNIYLTTGPRRLSPFFIPAVIINMISGNLSIKYGMKGPNLAVVTACTTGTHNIGLAARTIMYGDADVMVCGGAEMATSSLGIGGFSAARALSTRNDDPKSASRPWDKGRDGFVLGDGAGVLVLEEYESAKKRGARIYAELAGFGMSADAYHITTPEKNGAGAATCMNNTLKDAGMNPEDVDYVNAHGTSTPVGDVIEVRGMKRTFGHHASNLLISSTKSMIGHLLGAAGAVEAIFSILAIRDNVAPPTINLDNPDDECDLDFVAHQAKEKDIRVSLSNSFGFGGTNGSLLFKSLDD